MWGLGLDRVAPILGTGWVGREKIGGACSAVSVREADAALRGRTKQAEAVGKAGARGLADLRSACERQTLRSEDARSQQTNFCGRFTKVKRLFCRRPGTGGRPCRSRVAYTGAE